MNFVYLSPHFPPNYYRFCVGLREEGVNVLGVADAPYESLRPELRGALSEYYRVDDMNSYDALVRALGHFTHRHGKLDGIDSHSEHWLETEARLRTDFNMAGLRQDRIGIVKRKSSMKEIYRSAGIRVARGAVVRTLEEARRLVAETGYPVVAKPDVGVGAAATFKIRDDGELSSFFDRKPPVDYIVEEFIQGKIFSFDGLTDRDGNLVFFTSHAFSQGIMETV
ncbi:MAG: ATP-grasp domain-containing protein, partial [Deltaproteobacteria bacterium]|nr:ATP-grasp domain-containing protein [Deltaproteobacteria bacterium]